MRAERSAAPGTFLLAQLGGGARPFRYRGGVYRLLGATLPADDRVRHAHPWPADGFVYLQPLVAGADRPVAPPPAAPPHLPVPEPGPADAGRHPSTRASESAAASISSPGRPGPAPEAEAAPDTPGHRDFDAARRRAGTVYPGTNAATPQRERGAVGGSAVPHSVRPADAATPEDGPASPRPPAAETRVAVPGKTSQRTLFAALGLDPAGFVAAASRARRVAAAEAEMADVPPGSSRRTDAPARTSPAGLPMAMHEAIRPERRGDAAVPLADVNAPPNGATGTAPPRLPARLVPRPAPPPVHAMRARVAAPPVEAEVPPGAPESRGGDPMPKPTPAREVVVVRTTAPRSVPASFWASSTLRSGHLGVLR